MTNFDSDLINSLDPDKLYYLATPYSNPLESVRYDRFKQISIIAGDLLFKHGIKCITPICSSRPIAHFVQKEGDWETWQELDKMLIDHSDGVLVAQMLSLIHI